MATYREENDVQAWVIAVEEAAAALPDSEATKQDIVNQAHQLEVDLRNLSPAELGVELNPFVGAPLRWFGLDAAGRIKSRASDLADRIAGITGSNPLDVQDVVGGVATPDQQKELDGSYLDSAGVFGGDVEDSAKELLDKAQMAADKAKDPLKQLAWFVGIAVVVIVAVEVWRRG